MDTYTTIKKFSEDIVTLNNNNSEGRKSNDAERSKFDAQKCSPASSPNNSPRPNPRNNRNRSEQKQQQQHQQNGRIPNSQNNGFPEKNSPEDDTLTRRLNSEAQKTTQNQNTKENCNNAEIEIDRDRERQRGLLGKGSAFNSKILEVKNGLKNCHAQQQIRAPIPIPIPTPTPTLKKIQESFEPCSFRDAFFTYMCYFVLVVVGYINDLVRPRTSQEKNRIGYTQLYASFESFYTRHVYRRVRDGWNIPICSVPGEFIQLVHRITPDYGWTMEYTGKRIKCINLGSYNYLGFAENHGACAEDAIKSIRRNGINCGSSRMELGNGKYQTELDALVSRFVGTEDALTCAMGFATNALNLPCILDSNCLVISDEKNHASIILGLRTSGATCRVFKHNNMKSLEKRLRDGIVYGRPKTRLPWHKVFIVIEGVYSMEGSIVRLPEILALKKKYRAYIYLDEAHSIGAVGPRGRGVCDYWGVDPREIDILMGTFTKSFGSAGGYIAGSSEFIQRLRSRSHAHTYGTAMSGPVAEQIMSSMKTIMGEDGTGEGLRRIQQLASNSRYFRQKLKQMGFIVYGNDDSPVIPVALYMPSKIAFTVREMIKRGVAIVGVGFPATPLVEGRIRFCMSAAHTQKMLDYVLKEFGEIGESICARTSSIPKYKGDIKYEQC